MLAFVAMSPRVVVSLAVGLGLILNSAPVASAATPRAVPNVAVSAWFAGLHLDAGKPVVKNQCPGR